jgi:hypothetical protein
MQRKLIIEAFGLPEPLTIAAQMLMFIPSAPLAQNPLLAVVFISFVQGHPINCLFHLLFLNTYDT